MKRSILYGSVVGPHLVGAPGALLAPWDREGTQFNSIDEQAIKGLRAEALTVRIRKHNHPHAHIPKRSASAG